MKSHALLIVCASLAVWPTLCLAQQVHLSYEAAAGREASFGAIVTPEVASVFRLDGSIISKRDVSPEECAEFASVCLHFVKTRCHLPLVSGKTDVSDPRVQIHVFTGDRTISFTSKKVDDDLSGVLKALSKLMRDPTLAEILKEGAEPGATDNPDSAQVQAEKSS